MTIARRDRFCAIDRAHNHRQELSAPHVKYEMSPISTFASGVLPVNNGRVLLGREQRGWSGFSGRAAEGEFPLATALREFREETAHAFELDEEVLRRSPCVRTRTPRNKEFFLYLVPFDATADDPIRFDMARSASNLAVEREKMEVRWVPFEQVPRLLLAPGFRDDWPLIRSHLQDGRMKPLRV